MISSVHIDINKKDSLILVKGSTQVLDYTTSTVEAQYSISFSRSNITFCLSFHYNGRNSFFFVNTTKLHHFKAKDFEIK